MYMDVLCACTPEEGIEFHDNSETTVIRQL